MHRRKIALLLFGSGACSLVYETVWLRDLRLVFGASTMASAAVVACFVGGLGAGGLVFGKRADAHERPLALYAALEGAIAVAAAITPVLLGIVRAAYIATGGTRALGSFGGTVLRLVFSALVFAVPTVLMGGTLPAVARAVEEDGDRGRRSVAVLYGVNTLGAVTGCLASTFLLSEVFGTHVTLWMACLVNGLVAVSARSLSRSMPVQRVAAPVAAEEARRGGECPTWVALVAAGVAGWAFCLLELVWYRMLAPILGGTVFTFGVILALALFGIGLGGLAYGVRRREKAASLNGFAWICLLEAAFVAIPYALGDRLAVLAAVLRPLGGLSFGLQVASWMLVAGIVVVPAAFASGVQFPLLVGLFGQGSTGVGRDVGLAYATNTLGAILGSLAGGFGLIPALTAPGCWRLVVWLLVAIGMSAIVAATRSASQNRRLLTAFAPALAGVVAVLCLRASGPTAAWRHSPIGAGRVEASLLRTPNAVRAWEHLSRRKLGWEADGRESSVGIDYEAGLAFVVNGKIDGNARSDASTAVMSGLLGAILHPEPKRAMVIGLGTGETAGWLAAVETIAQVDVGELEPAIVEVARRSDAVNHRALANPKVHIEFGDGRELLLTSKNRYDLIASEPSNPYRAGVASLFTREYYEAVRSRLERQGIFLQWLQGYEVEAKTVRSVYATLAAVFPHVETWELGTGDMLLLASVDPIPHDVPRIRARLARAPYQRALLFTWRVVDLEGFFSNFVADERLTRRIADLELESLNTDDQNRVEFGFARSVGSGNTGFSTVDLRRTARERGEHRPEVTGGSVDWERVDDGVDELYFTEATRIADVSVRAPERAHRAEAMRAWAAGDAKRALAEWTAQARQASTPTELVVLGSALADIGDDRALGYAEVLRRLIPGESDAVVARLHLHRGELDQAATALEAFFARLRTDPWPLRRTVGMALDQAKQIASRDHSLAPRLSSALREPFVLHLLEDARMEAAFATAVSAGGAACTEAAAAYGSNVPWNEAFLRARYACFAAAHDVRAATAEEDLAAFRADEPMPFEAGLLETRSEPTTANDAPAPSGAPTSN
jgi:spermidine synthase